MNNILGIARREFQAYFNSPVAYIVMGAYLFSSSVLFFFIMGGGLFVQGSASMRSFFAIQPWLFMVLAPAVTMRLLAEERKTGTLEVLMTLPVNELSVVVGKFLGALAMIAIALMCTLVLPLTMTLIAVPKFPFDFGPVIGGYVGTMCMAAAFISVGMWASALTRNQIVSFIVSLVLCFGLIIISNVSYFVPETIGLVFQYLSASYHFENIARGVIDSRDLLYYFSLTAFGLRLTVSALHAARQ